MDIVGVDLATIARVARILKHYSSSLTQLNVYDERFYPPKDCEPELTARYFLVMVAIDHRLSRPGKPYEACLNDGCYKGADLLYRLGIMKLREEPGFFDPVRLSVLTVDELKRWLSVGAAEPPDPEVRVFLLRDLGVKLCKLYDSSVLKLLEMSSGRLHGTLASPGLVDNLRVFRAYEDPVEKKPMLLSKFLLHRGLFRTSEEPDVAVDNHLTRIALRLGLVMVSGPLWDRIKAGQEFTWEEDVILRMTVKRAYRYLAKRSGVKATVLDDYFWTMGRTLCTPGSNPNCEKCLFKGFCRARKNRVFMVDEPVYYNTWYY